MPSEQPPTRVHECPTCGSPVEVVSSDEGTHHYRPAPSEQPREGEARVDWPAKPQRGECVVGDSVTSIEEAERLAAIETDAVFDSDRLQEWFTELQASASLLPEDLQIIEAMIARASTHREQANGLKQLYEVDGIFLGKCKNITLYQCENVEINSSANVNIGDCMIEHLTHNNIEHEQDNLHKSPAPEGEGEAS